MAKVLICCEYTGIIREAFKKKGHDAMSCDLLDTEIPGEHYKGNVFDIINDGWDLMIAHPPCTYLSYASTKYWDQPGRAKKRIEALEFFLKIYEAPINHTCIENPLGIASQVIRQHDQIIQPYYFGDSEMKRTCLWLKNLPKLEYHLTDNLFSKKTATEKPIPIYTDKSGKKRYFTDSISGTQKGGHLRSASFPGIAKAMAEQWSDIINLNT